MDQNFDQILESAVIANWADLMHGARSGLIHVEYGFAPSGTLDYLQVWSSITRGRWLLACAYRPSASGFMTHWRPLLEWIRIGRSGPGSGTCDNTPERIRCSSKPRPSGISSDYDPHAAGDLGRHWLGERSLRPHQLCIRRSGRILNSVAAR
jgi:hypothetical protein